MRAPLVHLARAGWLQSLEQQQVPGLIALLRSFTSNSTKEAVEKAVIVDTLAQVRWMSCCGSTVCCAWRTAELRQHPGCLQSKKFESLGYTRQQAEEMTQYLTEQIILDRLRLSDKFSAKVELEKVRIDCLLQANTATAHQHSSWAN